MIGMGYLMSLYRMIVRCDESQQSKMDRAGDPTEDALREMCNNAARDRLQREFYYGRAFLSFPSVAELECESLLNAYKRIARRSR